MEINVIFRLRAAQGVLGLRDKHTPARLEAACAKAITVGDTSYRTIKGILIAGTEAPTNAGSQAVHGGQVAAIPAFLDGPKTLFEPSDDGALAAVLELPTTQTLPTHQPIGEAQ